MSDQPAIIYVAVHLLLFLCYVIAMYGTIYGLFGMVRTAATRLPIPPSKADTHGELFPFDKTVGLIPSSDRSVKRRKVRQFVGTFVVFFALWLTVVWLMQQFHMGMNADFGLTLVLHVVFLLVIGVPFVIRAKTHANRFKGLPPRRG